MFKEYGIKCTSYMVGQALLMNPEVGKWLMREGSEVASHGWRWVDRGSWTEEEEMDNVRKAVQGALFRVDVFIVGLMITVLAIEEVTGEPPRGWYYGMVQSKAGARSRALVAKVYKEMGIPLKYYSDDYSDDLPHWIPMPGDEKEGLLIVPYA